VLRPPGSDAKSDSSIPVDDLPCKPEEKIHSSTKRGANIYTLRPLAIVRETVDVGTDSCVCTVQTFVQTPLFGQSRLSVQLCLPVYFLLFLEGSSMGDNCVGVVDSQALFQKKRKKH
jgi:hypothetical protein